MEGSPVGRSHLQTLPVQIVRVLMLKWAYNAFRTIQNSEKLFISCILVCGKDRVPACIFTRVARVYTHIPRPYIFRIRYIPHDGSIMLVSSPDPISDIISMARKDDFNLFYHLMGCSLATNNSWWVIYYYEVSRILPVKQIYYYLLLAKGDSLSGSPWGKQNFASQTNLLLSPAS